MPCCIHGTAQMMKASRAIEALLYIVFARPQQLDGHTSLPRNPRRFHHEVMEVPPAEGPAHADLMDGDAVFAHGQCLGDELTSPFRML